MSYYSGKIKVVGADLMCFPVDVKSLEPLACSCYDPCAWNNSDDAVQVISVSEWQSRCDKQRGNKYE